MPFMRVHDHVLHFDLSGDPGKPVLVFANSLGTDARIWTALLPALRGRYSLLLYDKRGHGLSDMTAGRVTIEDHAEDLIGLVDRLGIERFGLVGLSVGGMIAQVVAARHPGRVAALVLCDTAARIGTAESWNARIAAIAAGGIAPIAETILERWFTADYRRRETAAMQGWRNMLTRQPAEGYASVCAAIRDADLTPLTASIAVPTLCVVGDQDLSTPPDLVRGTADLIPKARFEIIAGAGHLPCIEQPYVVAAAIGRHCAEHGYV